MKYWRGYLVAAILAACSWGVVEFAKANSVLVDMIYPFASRMIQDGLAGWSSGVNFCLWQLLLLLFVVAVLVTVVLLVVLKWNPIQWFGWVLAAVSVVFMLHTGLYGLNNYAGSLNEDIRLTLSEYTVTQLEKATTYYRDQAIALQEQIQRNDEGDVAWQDLGILRYQAGDGFHHLVYKDYLAVFAGSTAPVKELGWSDYFTGQGITGVTVALTGEAAVNPQVPKVGLPFAICHEMAHRMTIANDPDANMAAYLACVANSSVEYQYSAYMAAFRFCYLTLQQDPTSTGRAAVVRVRQGITPELQHDLDVYGAFFENADTQEADHLTSNLLVNWYVQEIYLPENTEEEDMFDPLDKNQVDLTGLPNAR